MEFTETQTMIRDTVKEFAESELGPIADQVDEEGAFPYETFEKIAEMGLTGISFPEAYGGGGADAVSNTLTIEEIAKVCPSTALSLAAHISLGTFPIYAFGTEEQKQKYVKPLASGKYMGAFGLTEPNAGSDAGGTQTTATRDGDSYVLNGSKMFVTNGSFAKTFVCTAVTDKAKGVRAGISAFIVERAFEGVEPGQKEDKLGMRGSDTCVVSLDHVRVPISNLLGEEGGGFQIFMQTLDSGRIGIAALSLGIAEGAFERAVKYAKERKQFGKVLGAFQAIQNMVADMATEIEAARHLTYHAARLKDGGKSYSLEASMAKLYASEMAMRVTDKAIQILGGYGYIKEYQVERYYRDAKLCVIGEGTSEIQRLVISRHILGRL